MTKPTDRLLRRLDDGRLVYRPYRRARAVILTEAQYRHAERVFLRKALTSGLSCVAVFLSTLLCLHLYNAGTVSPAVPVASLVALVVLATYADKRLGMRLKAVLDKAPVSVPEQSETVPSRLAVWQSSMEDAFRQMPSPVCWGLALKSSALLLWSILVLMTRIAGKEPAYPDIHVAIPVVAAVFSGLWLRIIFRARWGQKRA